ncbi:hypothetical protein H2248_012400 [Termitomyces sp. 'cryptogamus']|nr:hypothetical protein H2248_012400 [Termitomyces sp. 'cryptogamus']
MVSMRLWKPAKDIDISAVAKIIDGLSFDENSNDVKDLKESYDISEYWNTAPHKDFLQNILQVPHINLQKKHQREEDDTTTLVKHLKTVTDITPSSLARPTNFQNVVGKDKLITVNQPYETSTIPIVLYERAFGIFRDHCKQPPSDKAMNCLIQLTQVGCEWYPEEALQREAIAFSPSAWVYSFMQRR